MGSQERMTSWIQDSYRFPEAGTRQQYQMLLGGYVEGDLNLGHWGSLACIFADPEPDSFNKLKKQERKVRISSDTLSRKQATRKFD